MTHEIYKTSRPQKFADVKGQGSVVTALKKKVENDSVPHCCLFVGPSGVGKTTLARILAKRLGCDPTIPTNTDFSEINAADKNGIDDIRKIREKMHLKAFTGKVRVWIIDEAHELSRQSQNCLLKMLEDTPEHVYFFLCTTDPGKLIPTIRNRCSEFKLQLISDDVMELHLKEIMKLHKLKFGEDVIEKIVQVAEGSGRKALVLLDLIKEIEDDDEALAAIKKETGEIIGFKIAQEVCNLKATWVSMQKVLNGVKEVDSDPEGMRWAILGYAKKLLLTKNVALQKRAFKVISIFRDNLYDCKGAGLIANCYEVFTTKD